MLRNCCVIHGKRRIVIKSIFIHGESMSNNVRGPGSTFKFSDDVAINYQVLGQGNCPMLLIHGFGASLESWSDIEPLLADHFRLYLIDLKGCGYSSKPRAGGYSPIDQAEIVAAFIDENRLQNLVLVGHSYGGAVALLTYLRLENTANQSKHIDSLVLIDAAVYPQKLPFFVSIPRIPILNRLILDLIPAREQARFTLTHLFYDSSKIGRERIDRYAHFYDLPGSRGALIKLGEQIFPQNIHSLTNEISNISVPTLIIWGDSDPAVPVEQGYRLQNSIKMSKLEIIEHCGHVPQEEKPQETARIMKKFLL